ncbi:UNVERIFIED_CONTAM: hypothetical protein RMT77_015922 [Armadillidium vulgare]
MSGILPNIIILLVLITDPVVKGGVGRVPKEMERVLPVGLSARWGVALVEPDVWFQRGSSALLRCRIARLQNILATQPTAKVIWLKDDQPVDNKRSFITPQGHLNITKLVRRRGRSSPENDEGPYRCILTVKEDMEYMISAPPINLHLAELGRHVSVASTNVSVLNGTALRLSCNISSEPIAFLYWQKDGGDLPQDRITEPFSGVLQITNVESSDSGIYRCTALNDVLNKTRVSEDVTVVVTKPPITQETSSSSSSSSTSATTSGYIPPSFLYPTSNHTIKVVQRWWATFECLANGLPMPSITWKRKGVLATEEEPWEILKEKEIKVNFFGAGNLRIGNVSVKDAGRYLCTASSTNPQTGKVNSISQEIKLVVIVQPRVKRGSQNMTTLMAKTVRLNCSYDDPSMGLLPSGVSSPYFPAPRVIWYKNGVPMKLDTRIQIRENNELMFLNSGTSDSAIYQCLITNEAGYATSWSYLLVNSSEDHPQPPKQLQAVLLGSTSVWLSWSPENTPGTKIKGYSIHLTEHGPNPFESQVVSHNNSYVFELLKPNTNYSFYVRAYSNYASDPSEVFNFTTREAVPIAAPEFSLQKLSPSSLLVTWSPLSTEKARGKVDGYKIQWQRKKKDYYNLNEVGPHTFECELKGLHPGKTYKVRVLARTKVGYNEGVDWPWKSITLDDAVVNKNLPLPPILHVEPKADLSALLATWERNQSDTVPLTGYSLNYKIGDEPWNEPVFLPHTVTSYSIRISTEPSWYRVKVSGYNEDGEGKADVRVLHTYAVNPIKLPKPTVENVQLESESPTSVRMSWETSSYGKQRIAFYTVKEEKLLNSEELQVTYHRSLNSTAVIKNLVPFITYQFSVRAHVTENDFGPYSEVISISSLQSIPSAPKEMSFEPKDASTVEIRWEESNFDLEESPTKFEIIYTQNKTKPLQEWHHEDVKGDALSFTVSGLVSNTEYWFRIRGCRHDACGSYSDPYPALIPSAFSSTSDPSKMYLIVGLGVAVFILILVILLAIYLFKFRIKQPRPVLTSNANGSVIVNRADGHHHHHHSGGRNGVSDTGEGDYIPMLNRLHTDISATLDTKGGYNNTRVNGFTNPKCNGVVKTKELHCGTNSHSKMDDSEERERLYTPPTCDGEGDTEAISSSYVEISEESSDILKESKQPSSSREPPLTRTYPSDSEGVNSSQ